MYLIRLFMRPTKISGYLERGKKVFNVFFIIIESWEFNINLFLNFIHWYPKIKSSVILNSTYNV